MADLARDFKRKFKRTGFRRVFKGHVILREVRVTEADDTRITEANDTRVTDRSTT